MSDGAQEDPHRSVELASLFGLAAAFVYYVTAVPYFTDYYLKTAQEMTMAEYLANPSHPRAFMLHALSAPPPSIEIVITDLEVAHVDQDSILLRSSDMPATTNGAISSASTGSNDTLAGDDGSASDQGDDERPTMLQFGPEAPPPGNEILLAGENLDLLSFNEGDRVSLRTHALYESPLGWVPKDSILLRSSDMPATTNGAISSASTGSNDTLAGDDGSASDQGDDERPTMLQFGPEAPPPGNEILLAGENLDLLSFNEGDRVSLRTHALYESPLGWVPKELVLEQALEEFFNKDDLDALEFSYLSADGTEGTPIPYVETGEMRFSADGYSPGEPMSLEDLDRDTDYITTSNRIAGGSVDIYGLRITGRRLENRAPYIIVEDSEGRRARVFFNSRVLSEWYWLEDRLGDSPEVVVRGRLRSFTPTALRQLEADGNFQAVLDGDEILSRDGSRVITLDSPFGLGLGQN